MNRQANRRDVFFVSDRTGKTAESIGESLLSQFKGVEFEHHTFPFVTTTAEANHVAGLIEKAAKTSGQQPIVFSTLVNGQLEKLISSTSACVISLFNMFIDPLEQSLNVKSTRIMGLPHEEFTDKKYDKHIDAIDFAMNFDDGSRTDKYEKADVILVGVSRCAKTPTCLYLAMNFSIKAANYPLTEDDLNAETLPDFLRKHIDKVVGLTIQADQLSAIREKRRPNSSYASLKQCIQETRQAENIMQSHGIKMIDSTAMSIEEIAITIVRERQLLHQKH